MWSDRPRSCQSPRRLENDVELHQALDPDQLDLEVRLAVSVDVALELLDRSRRVFLDGMYVGGRLNTPSRRSPDQTQAIIIILGGCLVGAVAAGSLPAVQRVVGAL